MKVSRDSNVLTISADDITSANIEEFRSEIVGQVDDELDEVILDLENVTLIDSSGISLLVSIQNTLKKKSGQLKLINTSADIIRMFKLMRLDQHFVVKG